MLPSETHGFEFGYASRIFEGRWIAFEDTRVEYGETRLKAIGQVEADVLVVIDTWRGKAIRIVSARRAN
jgi:hypothetical protein